VLTINLAVRATRNSLNIEQFDVEGQSAPTQDRRKFFRSGTFIIDNADPKLRRSFSGRAFEQYGRGVS
jgi:hypothetical protein